MTGARFAVVAAVVAVAGAAAGCSSIVSDPCRSGYALVHGTCTATGADTPDAGPIFTVDTPPRLREDDGGAPQDGGPGADALVCEAPTVLCHGACMDLSADPENCGHCGRVCASGICASSQCVGEVAGHIVAIGHDYSSADPAMDRLIANAVAGGGATSVRIGWWRGTAAQTGAIAAAHQGLAQTGRTAFDVALGTITADALTELDAVVIEPQVGDGDAAQAAGAQDQPALDAFLATGRIVVVLETIGGTSYRYAAGAGLFVVAPPLDVSSSPVTVAQPANFVAAGVVSPYFARPGSVGYPGVAGPVVVDGSGNAIVFDVAY